MRLKAFFITVHAQLKVDNLQVVAIKHYLGPLESNQLLANS